MTTSRRTQAERRAATRALLVDAAIDSLVERGWAATTVVEVCARAGVTRGAFHHHYPALPALLADALRTLYDELRPTGPPPADLGELVEHMWQVTCRPRFKAVLEAWLAMANDPELGADVGPVVLEFAQLVSPDELPSRVLRTKAARTHYLVAREAILGLALGRATNGGRPLAHERAVVDELGRTAPGSAH